MKSVLTHDLDSSPRGAVKIRSVLNTEDCSIPNRTGILNTQSEIIPSKAVPIVIRVITYSYHTSQGTHVTYLVPKSHKDLGGGERSI